MTSTSFRKLYSATMRKLISESIIYIFAAVGNALALVVFVRVATAVLDIQVLDDVFLGRRYVPVLAALMGCGTSQVIQKYWTIEKDNGVEKLCILVATLCMCLFSFLIGICIFFFTTSSFSKDLQSISILYAIDSNHLLIAAFATATGQIVASVLLVNGRLILSGCLQALNSSLISLIIVGAIRQELIVSDLFQWTAYCSLIISLLALLYSVSGYEKQFFTECLDRSFVYWLSQFQKCAKFGIPRAFSTAMDFCLFAITPWLVSNELGKPAVFAIVLTVVKMSQLIIAPVSQIAGLRVATFSSHEQQIKVDKMISISALIMFSVGVIAAVVIFLTRKWIVLFLVEDIRLQLQVNHYLGYCSVALPGLMVFYAMRSVLELRFVMPVNLLSLIMAIVTHLGSYYVLFQYVDCSLAAAISFTLSASVLGLSTLILASVAAARGSQQKLY